MLKWLAACVLFLAACSPSETPAPPSNLPATAPPPVWVESVEPVGLDNITDIRYLGRLDQPDTPSTVFAYSFSPDATRLAGLTNDQLIIWDLLTGERIASAARLGANQVYFSPDKTEVYALNSEGLAVAYDAQSGVAENRFTAHSAYNGANAFFADEGWLAMGGQNGEVKVWDTYERLSLVTLEAHALAVNAVAFSADGERLLTAGGDGRVRLWDWSNTAQPEPLLDAVIGGGGIPVQAAIAPDGRQLAVATEDRLLLWAADDGTVQHTLDVTRGGASSFVRYSPDGELLLTGGADAELAIWNPATGQLIAQLPGTAGPRVSAAFSPDGKMLLTGGLDTFVGLWDLTRINDETVTHATLDIGSDQIIFVDWTNDSRLLAFFDATGPVHLWGIGASDTALASES